MARTRTPNTVVLWEGPSEIDGSPIVVLATGLRASKNGKTGAMVQTYILRADISPIEAMRLGEDWSICGNCPLRRLYSAEAQRAVRSCYVRLDTAPTRLWKCYRAGRYGAALGLTEITRLGADRLIRLGSYGDPAAVPWHVWQALLHHSSGHTGYTRQWVMPSAQHLRAVCMASVFSPREAIAAHSLGWRTFRTGIGRLESEVVCPASAEHFARTGKRLDCATCQGCRGASAPRSYVIAPHGAAKRFHPALAA